MTAFRSICFEVVTDCFGSVPDIYFNVLYALYIFLDLVSTSKLGVTYLEKYNVNVTRWGPLARRVNWSVVCSDLALALPHR